MWHIKVLKVQKYLHGAVKCSERLAQTASQATQTQLNSSEQFAGFSYQLNIGF
jgi:hypothetical protein